MAPGVNGDLVYVSTVPATPRASTRATARASSTRSTPRPARRRGSSTPCPRISGATRRSTPAAACGTAGLRRHRAPCTSTSPTRRRSWAPRSFPGPPAGPAPTRDTNTLVKLDAATGEVTVEEPGPAARPLRLGPAPAAGPRRHVGRPAARRSRPARWATSTPSTARAASSLWKTAVGQHNGHDDDNQLALDGKLDQLPKLPLTLLPGILGGVETQMAVVDDIVFAPIVNMPAVFKSQTELRARPRPGHGRAWRRSTWRRARSSGSTTFDTPAYGAATVVNDLVFTTTFDGKLTALVDRDAATRSGASSCRPAPTPRSLSRATS